MRVWSFVFRQADCMPIQRQDPTLFRLILAESAPASGLVGIGQLQFGGLGRFGDFQDKVVSGPADIFDIRFRPCLQAGPVCVDIYSA